MVTSDRFRVGDLVVLKGFPNIIYRIVGDYDEYNDLWIVQNAFIDETSVGHQRAERNYDLLPVGIVELGALRLRIDNMIRDILLRMELSGEKDDGNDVG